VPLKIDAMYVVQVAVHLRQMLHTDSGVFMTVVICKNCAFKTNDKL